MLIYNNNAYLLKSIIEKELYFEVATYFLLNSKMSGYFSWQEAWTRWPLQVPSNPNYSIILWLGTYNSFNKFIFSHFAKYLKNVNFYKIICSTTQMQS